MTRLPAPASHVRLRSRLLLGLGGLALAALASGCASQPPVKAWQRENLARASMSPEAQESEELFRQHIRNAREGSIGAYGQPGGGCGCN